MGDTQVFKISFSRILWYAKKVVLSHNRTFSSMGRHVFSIFVQVLWKLSIYIYNLLGILLHISSFKV